MAHKRAPILVLFLASVLCASACVAIASTSSSQRAGFQDVFSSALSANQLAYCTNPVSASCDWYKECLEAAQPCGAKGYAMSFGDPYCRKFAASKSISKKAREWRDKTMVCLQKSLVPLLGASGSPSAVCPEIRQHAFESHVHCYTASPSICSLPWSDLFKIAGIIGPGFLDPTGFTQASKVVGMCLCKWTHVC